MRMTRIVLVSGASLVFAAALAAPGGAQDAGDDESTTETSISYAAESDSAGVQLAITPPGATTPAAGVFGAATESSVSSDGPSAKGKADALAVLTQSPVTATTEAPPDDEKNATSPVPAITIPSVGSIAALQGTATSKSEAEDENPSTTNTGTFGALSANLNTLPAIPGLGAVSAGVNVTQMKTSSEAAAPNAADVSAAAVSDGVVISADLDIELLQNVCSAITVPQLQQACNTLTSQGQLLSVTVGPSNVSCAWDGKEADCEGEASTATINIAGTVQTVDPNQTVTIPDADPFLVRVRAGSFNETVEGGTGSAISSGISVELIGQTRANPGLVTLAVGQTTAGVNGEVETRDIIARTGGTLLPLLFGGSALVMAGYGLRRYLKQR
ncbi:MAG: hypothetical protein M3135_09160 [Actinomycetota bacterium]|nr:hypothetical protein [Actinomycetota bacterium]